MWPCDWRGKVSLHQWFANLSPVKMSDEPYINMNLVHSLLYCAAVRKKMGKKKGGKVVRKIRGYLKWTACAEVRVVRVWEGETSRRGWKDLLETQYCFAINCGINAVGCEEPTQLLLLDVFLWGQKSTRSIPSKAPWRALKLLHLGVNKR